MTAPVLDPTAANVRRVAECVRNGGVVAVPTDTNVGLLVDPWHADAIEQVYELKGRSRSKPLTLFVRAPEDWRRFGTHDDRLCMGSTVSIGCISNPTWREIVAEVGCPVAMTSANKSGEADDRLVDVECAREQVGDGVEYIVAGEPQGTTTASTILDMTGEPDMLRKGDITAAALNDVASLGL